MGRSSVAAEALVDMLTDSTGVRFEVVGALTGGESGALQIVDPAGRRFVLKWQDDPSSRVALRHSVPLAERLRVMAGWPLGPQRLLETPALSLVLRPWLPGSDVTVVTHGLVEELLELHRRRLGLAGPEDGDTMWPYQLLRTLTVGGVTNCRHDVVRSYSERTARLVDHVERVGRELRVDDLVGDDVIHCDLHPGNLLQIAGRLSAVIDTDFVTVGDAAFDLLTLAVSSREIDCESGVPDRLMAAACSGLDDMRRRAYLGHLAVKFLDWPIRGGRHDEAEFWIAEFEALLEL